MLAHTTFIKGLHASEMVHIQSSTLSIASNSIQFLFNTPSTKTHTTFIMSGQSNVGNSQVYEAGDQRTVSNAEIEQQKKENRFHEGKENSHNQLDSSKPPQHF